MGHGGVEDVAEDVSRSTNPLVVRKVEERRRKVVKEWVHEGDTAVGSLPCMYTFGYGV